MTAPLPDTDQRVRIAIDADGVAQVLLNRPEKLNALDPAMFEALLDAGTVLSRSKEVRCVVLAGEGAGFCAGLDLAMFEAFASGEAPPLAERTHGDANRWQQAALQWRRLPVPVIAAVHGACLGGGLQIAGGADIRIVAPDARLAVLETRWGLVPDMGGFLLWRGLVREDMLRELTWTAREFSGTHAAELGFATHVDADPLARARAIAREIAGRSPCAIREAKLLFRRAPELDHAAILLEESLTQHRLLGSRNQQEAMRAHAERRAPVFKSS